MRFTVFHTLTAALTGHGRDHYRGTEATVFATLAAAETYAKALLDAGFTRVFISKEYA